MDKDQKLHGNLNRRDFITGMAVTLAAAGAGAAALTPLLRAEEIPSVDEFLQKNYKQLTTEDKKEIFARLEKKIDSIYGVKATIRDPQPMDGVEYGYALNIGRCIGCRKCVYACMKENNLSREPQLQYIRVLKMKKEGRGIDLESSVHDYPQNEAGDEDYYYMPVQCQQCENPPCVKVCPVKATWKEKDGIVVVDYNWCIGCRYCAEVCPTGARKFGNLKDPNSEIRKIIENERVYVLKEELGTVPKFYYIFAK